MDKEYQSVAKIERMNMKRIMAILILSFLITLPAHTQTVIPTPIGSSDSTIAQVAKANRFITRIRL